MENVTDVVPEMLMKRDTIFLHKEDIERVLMDKLPGYIPDVSGGAQMPGCRLITFKSNGTISGLPDELYSDFLSKSAFSSDPSENINKFFQLYANYILVKMFPDGFGGVFVEYTSMLNTEDTNDLQEIAAEQRKAMNTKRIARRNAAEAVEKAKQAEIAELLELGRKAKEHNLMERLKEYESNITELKRELKNAKRVK